MSTSTPSTSLTRLRRLSDAVQIPYLAQWDAGAVVLELYEHLVEARTEQPTFYIDFPLSVSPLTRPHRSKPGVAERWDLVAWGVELGTAYSELTDPVEQRRRLEEQSLLAAGGDPEAMELDEDFLQAMEYAMPPTGGLGMGVDRVVMLDHRPEHPRDAALPAGEAALAGRLGAPDARPQASDEQKSCLQRVTKVHNGQRDRFNGEPRVCGAG